MIGREPSEAVRVVCATVGPFIMVFGAYVIAHGHYGPGGGFAGGVVVAIAVVLTRMVFSAPLSARVFPTGAALPTMGVGMGLFLLAGFAPVVDGGAFLDYGSTPRVGDGAPARYLGIFVVEVGVGLVVAGGMVLIHDLVAGFGTDAAPEDTDGSRAEVDR